MLNNYRSFKNGTTKLYHYKPNGRAMTTLIDTKELDRLIDIDVRWSIVKHNKSGVHRVVGRINGKLTYLSRFLMNCPDHLVVDHINRDTLDNRKSNLRCVTTRENNMNRSNSKSADQRARDEEKKKGIQLKKSVIKAGELVVFDTKIQKYRIKVKDVTDDNIKYYGAYDTVEEAEKEARAVRKLFRKQLPSK